MKEFRTYFLTVYTDDTHGATYNLGRSWDEQAPVSIASHLLKRDFPEHKWDAQRGGEWRASNGDWAIVTVALAS